MVQDHSLRLELLVHPCPTFDQTVGALENQSSAFGVCAVEREVAVAVELVKNVNALQRSLPQLCRQSGGDLPTQIVILPYQKTVAITLFLNNKKCNCSQNAILYYQKTLQMLQMVQMP